VNMYLFGCLLALKFVPVYCVFSSQNQFYDICISFGDNGN